MRKKVLWHSLLNKAILKVILRPPQTSRAKIRGDFIEKALRLGFDITVNLTGVRLNNPYKPMIDLPDPFENEKWVNDRMDQLDVIVPEKSTA